MNDTIFVFIDGQNLYQGTRDEGWTVDYQKFRLYLRNKYQAQRVFIFLGYIGKYQSLYDSLTLSGFELVFKPVIQSNSKKSIRYKGNVDAELVLHTMIHYENFDKAIIISSDGDFYCLLEYLAEKSKLLKVITTNRKYSSLLRKLAPYIQPIERMRSSIQKK